MVGKALRRTSPLLQVEHFLDSAQECSELDACSATALRLYGDDVVISATIDRADPRGGYQGWVATCVELARVADRILTRLPPARRSGLVYQGLSHASYKVGEAAECLAAWAFGDEVDGGYLEPFRAAPRSRRGVPWRRTARRLGSPGFIRRYARITARREMWYQVLLVGRCVERALRLGAPAVPDPTIRADWLAQVNWSREAAIKQEELERRRERRAVVRAWRTAVSVLGSEAVSAFVRGEEVRLVGAESILALRLRGRLTDKGHGALSVALLSRDGVVLADLCTFIEGTPALDQLTGYALFMGAGDDRAVIAAANLIQVTDAGRSHQLVEMARSRSVERVMQLVDQNGLDVERMIAVLENSRRSIHGGLSYEDEQARVDAYWQRTKGYWLRAASDQMIGVKNFHVFRAAGVKLPHEVAA